MKAIDLFAGAGGFSTGARMAGVDVVWAANHWQAAVSIHAENHPDVVHSCQDLHQADWSAVPSHDLLLASPACQGHSRARGKERPHHDAQRNTAWAVVSAVEYHRPAFALVENVTDFTKWALYPAWCSALHALGYALTPMVIDAADHGVPQNRLRLFVVCSRSRYPIEIRFEAKPHAPASSFIDFKAGNWSPIDRAGRSVRTLQRVSAGRTRHGDRFLTAYYGNETGGRSLNRPIGTITTRDRYAVIDGDRMRMVSATEYRDGMGFPATYKLPAAHRDAVHLLGNAVCPPVAADVISELRRAA